MSISTSAVERPEGFSDPAVYHNIEQHDATSHTDACVQWVAHKKRDFEDQVDEEMGVPKTSAKQ
jgi:hypothetical protein